MAGPFNVPYLVGDKYQRDHQYFPTDVTTLELFTDIALETLMQDAWLVREWTISAGNFSFNGFNPSTSQTWFMSGSWPQFVIKMKRKGPTWNVDNIYRDVTDERDILGPSDESFINPTPHTLLNAGIFGGAVGTGTYRQPADNFPGAVTFGGTNGNILGERIRFNDSTKEFNPLSGTYVTGLFTFPLSAPRAEVFFGLKDGGAGSFKLFDSVVDSEDPIIDCGMEVIGVHTPNHVNEGTGTVSDIIMRATKWWPYSNSLGQPIYVEATGLPTGADPFA